MERLVEIIDNVLKSKLEYESKRNSIIEILVELLRQNETKIVLVDNDTNRKWIAGELLNAIVALGVNLVNFGVSKGDVVVVFAANSDLHVIANLSIWAIGAVYTGLIHKSPLRELKNIITKTNARYLIGSKSTIDVCNEFICSNNIIKTFFVIEECSESNPTSVHSLIRSETGHKEKELFFELMAKVKPNDLCKISFSSGTTGQPKAVKETQQRYMYLHTSPEDLVTKFDTIALLQPLAHGGGSLILCLALLNNANLIVFSQFNADDFVRQTLKHSITFAFIVPTHLRLLNATVSKPVDSLTLRTVITGAEFAPKLICEEFIEKFKPKYFALTYGSTEVGWALYHPVSHYKGNLTSSGIPMTGCQFKIIDTETGDILGANKIGEIYIKGPQSTAGYLNNDTANRESFDEQLFFKTGDIGYFDEHGYVYVTDRIKEVIKYNSQQVSPNELQTILLQHEAVKEAAVIGIPDQVYGQLPKAFVVLKELFKGKIVEDDLLRFVDTQVTDFKKLRGGLVFMNEMPMSSIGKIDRKVLKSM